MIRIAYAQYCLEKGEHGKAAKLFSLTDQNVLQVFNEIIQARAYLAAA